MPLRGSKCMRIARQRTIRSPFPPIRPRQLWSAAIGTADADKNQPIAIESPALSISRGWSVLYYFRLTGSIRIPPVSRISGNVISRAGLLRHSRISNPSSVSQAVSKFSASPIVHARIRSCPSFRRRVLSQRRSTALAIFEKGLPTRLFFNRVLPRDVRRSSSYEP